MLGVEQCETKAGMKVGERAAYSGGCEVDRRTIAGRALAVPGTDLHALHPSWGRWRPHEGQASCCHHCPSMLLAVCTAYLSGWCWVGNKEPLALRGSSGLPERHGSLMGCMAIACQRPWDLEEPSRGAPPGQPRAQGYGEVEAWPLEGWGRAALTGLSPDWPCGCWALFADLFLSRVCLADPLTGTSPDIAASRGQSDSSSLPRAVTHLLSDRGGGTSLLRPQPLYW